MSGTFSASEWLAMFEAGEVTYWPILDAAVAVNSGTHADVLTFADRSRLFVPVDGEARVLPPAGADR